MHFFRHIQYNNRLDFHVCFFSPFYRFDMFFFSLCFSQLQLYIFFGARVHGKNMSDVYYIFIRKNHKDEYHVHFAVIYCVEIKHWVKWTLSLRSVVSSLCHHYYPCCGCVVVVFVCPKKQIPNSSSPVRRRPCCLSESLISLWRSSDISRSAEPKAFARSTSAATLHTLLVVAKTKNKVCN